ncbi:MAG: hypothetical protein K2N13_00355 [Paraprevotella sp.]|nr:hypothetical protein [Paraprevotella sp.]
MKNKRFLYASLAVLLSGAFFRAEAQTVVFPQAEQPGRARVQAGDGIYTLSNDLLSASFVREDGRLLFGGCDALTLQAGTELFKLRLGNGTEVCASEMTLAEVRTVELAGDPAAVKGSKRFDGKAVEADFAYGNLNITWRAVLRDGSHYLRTELDVTATKDTPMNSLTPMMYCVDNLAGGTVPVVVGNTRGAVLASDRIFAGLETPMGLNTSGTTSDMDRFTHDAWTANSFAWTPGEDTPQGILALGYTTAQIVGTRGYLVFRETGEYTLTFAYSSGSHRLNIVGVDLLKDGEVVASDYHYGFTGNLAQNNTYRLAVPESGAYQVRYFCEVRTETITSSGVITYDKKVSVPVIVYDQPAATVAAGRAKAPKALPAGSSSIGEDEMLTDTWKPADWKVAGNVPPRITELGFGYPDVKFVQQPFTVRSGKGTLTAEFIYKTGNNGLSIVGVDMTDEEGNIVASDYHKGFSGNAKTDNLYTMNVPYEGAFTLRYFCENRTEANTSTGEIKLRLAVVDTIHLPAPTTVPIQGVWSRNTTLAAGKTWSVGSVVGLIAPGQARRSFLAYSERERAVPWRPYPVYISWYELNIDRNNSQDYSNNMTVAQCSDVIEHWKTALFDAYGTGIEAFVWDDGWDEYGTWTFNKNFPDGFAGPDALARDMGSGIGAWLGPVGGYGQSGNYRRSYWSGRGGMQLSNPAYYKVFLDACNYMIDTYDFRFFKFDGISAQFSAVGPDAGTTGEENAEAIIDIEREIRKSKEDIFLNTTVGTWASPFWFQFTDAVWRQENDYGTIGNQGTDRERWITYRDRLVYQNFVQNSPLCPINTLMTHGFILTSFGNVSKNMDYAGIVREMRCAFACGSGMVELYNDYKLMNNINGDRLWADLAECIRWQRDNADVLADIHWVGGNPWDGSRANVYGWASWNGRKATLALRNPSASPQTYTTTLRQALDIPAYVNTTVTLSDAFAQAVLSGLPVGEPVDIDTELTLNLPASSVFVYNGLDGSAPTGIAVAPVASPVRSGNDTAVYDLTGRRVSRPASKGIYVVGGKKVAY